MYKKPKLTIFTPTYNRENCINRVYESLTRQTVFDFEWIVIDDGSTDNTNLFFTKVIKSNLPFKIKYYYTEHGGKHRAINKAVKIAEGFLFFILDSDDFLDNKCVEIILNVEKTIKNNKGYAGICAPRHHFDSQMIGTSFKGTKYLDITNLERDKNLISGDKAEIFYTSILKQYPFPEFENEDFISEAIVWDKIAFDGYKMRYFNSKIYYCEYRDDGLTKNIMETTKKCPIGDSFFLKQQIKLYKINFFQKQKKYFEYYSNHNKNLKIKQICKLLEINFLTLIIIVFFNKTFNFVKKIF